MVNEHEVISLFYSPAVNRFINEDSEIVQDIFKYITPNQFTIFIKYKEDFVVPDITNSFLVLMIYPNEEYDP